MGRIKAALCFALALLLSVLLVACGGSSSSSSSSSETSSSASSGSSGKEVEIDVGLEKPVVVEKKKPHIGLIWTSGNLFLDAYKNAAEEEAKKRGIELTVLDSKFDPIKQLQQVQDALQKGEFDGLIVVPLDGNTMCPILTQQAPAQNIPVVTSIVPMCNKVTAPEGDSQWSPGTVSMVGFTATVDANKAMYKEVDKRVGPGEHVGALFLGPPLIAGSIASKAAMEEVQEAGELKNLEVKYYINTDFTTPDGFAKAQTLLQAHPEVDTIITIYSDITVGVIRAIQAGGLEGKVKVYDQGASQQSLEAIENGELEMTTGFFPATYGTEAVDAMVNAFEGKKVDRWYGAYVQGSKPGEPVVIDKSNIGEFEPEY
jgi:ribose transport system substrate-binding protein